MVAPHAEDRFCEPDWYFGKQTTDITKRSGKQIPTHAYNPQIKNAPIPYHVIPYHDMSEKFRNRIQRERRTRIVDDTYHGRRSTEITSPTRYSQEETDVSFLPWPPSSNRIGDLNFSRFEYLHPLGKTRPSPMDDYVPILRSKRTGKVINNPSPRPSRTESRRRLLGLHPDGCHSPDSPCRSGSPSQPEADQDDDEHVVDESLDCHRLGHPRSSRPNGEYRHQGASQDVASPAPPQARSDSRNDRPHTAPVDRPSAEEAQKPRRRRSYLSSSYGNNALHVQPVGGRHQRTHADEAEERKYVSDDQQPQSPDSYVSNPAEVPRVRYSLGSMSQNAQPVGGRASIVNMLDMDECQTPRSDYTEASASYHPPHPPKQTSRSRAYPPQHHSFSQEPSRRDRDDEAFSQHKFRSNRDDRSTVSSQTSRKASLPPKYDPNLPPESERGRVHRRSTEQPVSNKDAGGGR